MRRRIFNVLAGMSLLLCVATAVIWVRSYWVGDELIWAHQWEGNNYLTAHAWDGLQVGHGGINFDRQVSSLRKDQTGTIYSHMTMKGGDNVYPIEHPTTIFNKLGFEYYYYAPWHLRSITVPCYGIVLITAIGPICSWLLPFLKRRRLRAGFCLRCGYDLRATPDRCPECGTVPPKPSGNSK